MSSSPELLKEVSWKKFGDAINFKNSRFFSVIFGKNNFYAYVSTILTKTSFFAGAAQKKFQRDSFKVADDIKQFEKIFKKLKDSNRKAAQKTEKKIDEEKEAENEEDTEEENVEEKK